MNDPTELLPLDDPRRNPLYKPHGPRDYSRRARKTSPKPSKYRPQNLTDEQRQKRRDLMLIPERRQKLIEGRRRAVEAGLCGAGRIKGAPDGIRYKDYVKLKEHVQTVVVPKVMKAMAETKKWVPDNDKAEQAMKAAVEIVSLPGEHRLRLLAAKTILDFTQKKPTTTTDMTLHNAQSFLQSVLDEENGINTGDDSAS